MRNNLKGSILLLITAMIWGTCFVSQSVAMDNIGPLLFMTVRFFLGGLVLVPFIILFNRRKVSAGKITLKEQHALTLKSIKGGIFCGLGLLSGSIFQQYGIMTTSAGKAGFITALYIVFVPIAYIFRGRKASKKVWLCVLIAMAGFYLLSVKEGFSIETGDILLAICAVGFTFQITMIDYFLEQGADPLTISSTQFFTVSAICFFPMLIFEGFDTGLIRAAAFPILYSGLLSCGLAYTLQIIGQIYTEPTLASLIMSLESVFAALSGWIILNETLSPRELLGCALVFAAVILAQINPRTCRI